MLHVNTPICTSPRSVDRSSARSRLARRVRRRRAVGACSVEARGRPGRARHGSPPGGRVPATGRCAPRDPPRAREVRSGREGRSGRSALDRRPGTLAGSYRTTNSETHKRIFTTERRPESCGRRPDYDLNRDASRGSAVRTPRGLIAIRGTCGTYVISFR
jgi:hypothetical protein